MTSSSTEELENCANIKTNNEKLKTKNKKYNKNKTDISSKIKLKKFSKGEIHSKTQQEKINALIDADIKHSDAKEIFKSYISDKFERKQYITVSQYKSLLKSLNSLSSKPEEQVIIISKALNGGWNEFYPLDTKKQKTAPKKLNNINKTPIKDKNTIDAREEVQ